jgi:hypothetical protein
MKKLLWIALIFSSCSPVYVPNVRNAALFRGAGEVQVSGHVGSGVDLQSAVSVTDHIGVMANYEFMRRTRTGSDKYIKHNFWEGAVGYYENSDNLCYEIFGGYGKGEGTVYENYGDAFAGPTEVLALGKYQRFFIQPSIGSNHRIFNWIVSARISYVDVDEFVYDGRSAIHNDPVIFFEPAFTGRINFGKSPIYTQFQTGLSLDTTYGEPVYDYEAFNFSFGFGIRLGGLPREKAEGGS